MIRDDAIDIDFTEIYGDIVFDHSHTCAAEFEDETANIAVVSGVSKGSVIKVSRMDSCILL